jgi:hypothetical protein
MEVVGRLPKIQAALKQHSLLVGVESAPFSEPGAMVVDSPNQLQHPAPLKGEVVAWMHHLGVEVVEAPATQSPVNTPDSIRSTWHSNPHLTAAHT